jgi:GNAT superfamily N-acetyltransferase
VGGPPGTSIGSAVAGSSTKTEGIVLREPTGEDAAACAEIVFNAFGGIHDHHRFPRDFPTLEAAAALIGAWIPHPRVWGVVAELDGRVVGSNFLDERDPIRGVGPITIDPEAQNAGVGRKLMDAVLERGRDARGIRLVQDGFHMRSLSLYASLGFRVTAATILMNGQPEAGSSSGVEVRPLAEGDLEECGRLCERVLGFDRNGALGDALHAFKPIVAVRDGRIVAYATTLSFWPMGHGVAESQDDMEALLAGAAAAVKEPLALLVPLQSDLFHWCLRAGLRGVKPMNVMSLGEYREPTGSWFPSVLY